MGEIPPIDKQTQKILDRIRSKQASINSYRYTITETTVTQLSNGSELTHTQKWNVAVKYTENGVLTRVASWDSDSPQKKDINIYNGTAAIQYIPSENEYRIQNKSSDHASHLSPHTRTRNGSYQLFEAPLKTIKNENAIHYNGTATVNGEKTYVIHLNGNPNGGNLAYYAAQTLWVDTDTGVVLKQTAQKPHLDSMSNVSIAELRNPEDNPIHNDTDDAPDAVYLGDKTITTTYTNVSINTVSNSTFNPNIPEGADVERATQEEQ
ncbi:hypothetical protein DMJ13_19770 [halophilic archaeon]|nr:hypothetical protein DMJ13_19770 [halophilic archaeon]